MENIYKLTYADKETALADLKAKGVLVDVEFNGEKHEAYGQGVQAVVEIGKIILTPAVLDGMEVIEEPIYADGYHYDILTENEYNFGANEVKPKNPKHAFAGYAITDEVVTLPNFEQYGVQE